MFILLHSFLDYYSLIYSISIIMTGNSHKICWISRVANPPKFFLGEISIFLVRCRATCQLSHATFFVYNIKRLHTSICCPFQLIIITPTVKDFLLNELLCIFGNRILNLDSTICGCARIWVYPVLR